MKEFARISAYLAPLAGPEGLSLLDDAALIPGPAGLDYAVTKDAIVEGVHFLPDTEAGLIARKLLRTNLSDMAAMGATPKFYLIAAALPASVDDAWYGAFTTALAAEQDEWGIALLGGDTTATSGPLTLSCTMLGEVPHGAALKRSGAKPGDGIYVSGTLGDAALGLRILRHRLRRRQDLLNEPQGNLENPEGVSPASADGHPPLPPPQAVGDYLIHRYHFPQPRVSLGLGLRGIASACMDISDGLLGDMAHICKASGIGATLHAEKLPLSQEAQAAGITTEIAATGGDDYELLFTVPENKAEDLKSLADKLRVPLTRIGKVVADDSVALLDISGKSLNFSKQGWQHG